MNIPFNEAALLQSIAKEEDAKLSWIEKKFDYKPYTIVSTEALAQEYKKPLDTQAGEIVFRPFKFKYLFFILAAIAVAGIMIPLALNPEFNERNSLFLNAVILFGFVAFAGVLIDMKRKFLLTLSTKEININNERFAWKEINKVYIMSRKQGKNTAYFLILALRSGDVKKYNCTSVLTGLGGTRKKLSAYIDYYKGIA